jgi:hypothetical protein
MKCETKPELPTREKELEYLKDFEASVLTDPWVSAHPKLYLCSPYRLYWKQRTAFKNEYYKKFFVNGYLSCIYAFPLIL